MGWRAVSERDAGGKALGGLRSGQPFGPVKRRRVSCVAGRAGDVGADVVARKLRVYSTAVECFSTYLASAGASPPAARFGTERAHGALPTVPTVPTPRLASPRLARPHPPRRPCPAPRLSTAIHAVQALLHCTTDRRPHWHPTVSPPCRYPAQTPLFVCFCISDSAIQLSANRPASTGARLAWFLSAPVARRASARTWRPAETALGNLPCRTANLDLVCVPAQVCLLASLRKFSETLAPLAATRRRCPTRPAVCQQYGR